MTTEQIISFIGFLSFVIFCILVRRKRSYSRIHNEVGRENIERMEDILAQTEQIHIPVRDFFTKGMYVREITIPEGIMLTSEIHKTEHPFVVSKGKIAVYDGDNPPVIIEAPYTGVTPPNTKRIAHALEETVWTTFHPTNLKDVNKIRKAIIQEPTPERASLLKRFFESKDKLKIETV